MENLSLNSKNFVASSIILLIMTSLSACTTAERQSYVRELPDKTTEAPVTQSLNELKAGQPLNYYTQQFERMGYAIDGIRSVDNRQVYDLRKGNERAMVGLAVAENQNFIVSHIDIQQYRAQTPDEQTVSAVVSELEQLQPGKKPHEYIPIIAKYGRIVEYEMDRNGAEIEFQSTNNARYYQVNMTIDPQQQIVTRINVDRNIWGVF